MLTPDLGRRLARWPAFIDGAVDALLVAFAGWTALYEVALATQRSLRWAAWPWLAVTLVLIIVFGCAEVRRIDPSPFGDRLHRATRRRPVLLGVALAAVVVAVLVRGRLGMVPLAVVGVVVLGAHLWPWARGHTTIAEEVRGTPLNEPHGGEHLLALLLSLGLGVLASFMLKPDADDVFYVNRATWIANHGVPVTHDTMFSPGVLPVPYNGGLPTPSVEALQGALAHAIGVQAPTVAYLLWVPLLATVFGWVTWRLVRTWTPRCRPVVYVVALAFVLASGSAVIGSYSIGRIWQGKVTAYAVLLPLIWMYLSRLAAGNSRRDQLMLLVAGLSFVGLTTTSALLGPVIVAAAFLAAAILRSKQLALGALCLLVAPLINGVVQILGPAQVGDGDSAVASASQVFDIAFGTVGLLALLGVLGVVFGPRLVPGPAGVVAATASLAVLAAYLPGMLTAANAATNAGAVVWRLAIEAPTGVMVGLLVTRRWRLVGGRSGGISWAGTGLSAGVAAIILVVLVSSGRWVWTSEAGGQLTSHPAWKVDQTALADVRAALRLRTPPGRWLLPPTQMQILAISTSGPFAVVARDYYLPYLHVADRQLSERTMLLGFAGGRTFPTVARLSRALRRLDVSLACVPASNGEARRTLVAATGADLRRVGDMRCRVGPAAY